MTGIDVIAQGTQPAGGAAVGEIVIATAGAAFFSLALLVLGFGHRSGRVALLGRAADWAGRRSGLPAWSALPAVVATISLLTAVFGMYWDIALHIGVGRDEGPLANPAHYFILIGLFGIFAAGFFAMVLPKEKPSAAALKLGPGWYAPLGGVLICACGAFSLIGFPLDDMWHRLFGQDVTLWGPTHLMLIGGAAMTLIGIAVLGVEGLRAAAAGRPGESGDGRGRRGEPTAIRLLRTVALTGGLLIGLSTFQAEFDFGVPQFRFVFQPLLVMLAASLGLVVARQWGGRGAALGSVAFFLVVRGLLTVVVGPVLGEPMPHFPLYLVEALVVEAIALRIDGRERPLAFGAWCGAGIGTIGLAAEWGWSHVFMPIPWPAELLPEAAILGFAAALAGGLLGAWVSSRLSFEPTPGAPALRAAAVLGAAVVAVIVVYALQKPADAGVRAQVALTEVRGGPQRAVSADVTLAPRSAADGAEWLTVTAWQGDGLVVDRLREVAPGRYRSTEPIPVHGNWKALVRLHRGNSLTAVPIFLPRDAAIPAREVPASPRFERTFVADHTILQREQKTAAGWLWVVAYAVVAGIALSLLGLLAWGLHRLGTASGGGEGRAPRTPAPRPVRRARVPAEV
ncbi:MAG TPA: hypothetical protein VF533_19485 [Solirubrobacteraceae bacterium]|jgi:hypothetical protein